MDAEKKIEIILQCIEIAENLILLDDFKEYLSITHAGKQFHINLKKLKIDKNEQKFIVFNNKIFIYVKDYPEVYDQIRGQILRSLRKYRYISNNAFSKDYIIKFIDTIVFNILNEGISYVRENPLHVDMFDRFFHEVIIFLPLDGIKMSIDSLSLGKMILTAMSEEKVKLLYKGSPLSHPDYFKDLIGKTCAEFKTFAESKSALKEAKKEIETILDLINYSVPFIYPKSLGVSVGLQGKIAIPSSKLYIANSDLTDAVFEHLYPMGRFPFEISNINVEIMDRVGVFKISDILKKPSKISNFEQTILLGVHWFADSQIQTKLENEFLSLMICLEIFLTPNDKRDPISTSIAEAIAIILKPENERKALKTEIKEYYDMRSNIVHGREVKIKQEEVDKLKEQLKQLIQFMIRQKDDFNSKEDLMELISEYKLAGINFARKLNLK